MIQDVSITTHCVTQIHTMRLILWVTKCVKSVQVIRIVKSVPMMFVLNVILGIISMPVISVSNARYPLLDVQTVRKMERHVMHVIPNSSIRNLSVISVCVLQVLITILQQNSVSLAQVRYLFALDVQNYQPTTYHVLSVIKN